MTSSQTTSAPRSAERGLNQALWSPKMLVAVAVGTPALLALEWLSAGSASAILRPTLIAWAILASAMSVVLHEKIARCESPYFERVLRFAGLLALVLFVPTLLYADKNPSMPHLIASMLASLLLSAITVASCYHFDPKGPGRYFSISAKFNNH